uniref:Uncharacterized protein n=1 Tax=Rhizophora mucronata TaxID=61149 RepID=A0A2P2PYM6_RHIMU
MKSFYIKKAKQWRKRGDQRKANKILWFKRMPMDSRKEIWREREREI